MTENKEVINRILNGAMGIKCCGSNVGEWVFKCSVCGKTASRLPVQIDFFTAEGFFKLWNWAQEQDWWSKFFLDHSVSKYTPHRVWSKKQVKVLINPDRFAPAVYDFLKEM